MQNCLFQRPKKSLSICSFLNLFYRRHHPPSERNEKFMNDDRIELKWIKNYGWMEMMKGAGVKL